MRVDHFYACRQEYNTTTAHLTSMAPTERIGLSSATSTSETCPASTVLGPGLGARHHVG